MSKIDYDGPGTLHITNITEAAEMDKTPIDRIITVCQDSIEDNIPHSTPYEFYCMSDGDPVIEGKYGGTCEYSLFEDAANTLCHALEDEEKVLIHCHMGTSRSVAIATAALGRLLELSRSEALGIIHYYRPRPSYPDSLLMSHSRKYIKEHTNIGNVPFSGIGE